MGIEFDGECPWGPPPLGGNLYLSHSTVVGGEFVSC